MALKAVTTLDIPGLTQIIVYNNPTLVDEIDFGSNQITLKAISSFSLSKSDFLLYFQYLDIYNNALLFNFPSINASINVAIAQSEFDFKVGTTRIDYTQTHVATTALGLTYLFSNTTMTFAARASDVTISLQEWFTLVYNLRVVTKQVSLN